jgi:hypothetical protein
MRFNSFRPFPIHVHKPEGDGGGGAGTAGGAAAGAAAGAGEGGQAGAGAGGAAAATPALPEGLPADWKERLAKAEKLEKAAKDAEDARLSDIDKANKKALDAEARAIAADKRAAAARHGLPPELAARLVGSTEAEIEADAQALKKLIPTAEAKPANTGTPAGGDPKPAGAGGEVEKKRTELAEAQKKNDGLAVLRLQREIGALEAKK